MKKSFSSSNLPLKRIVFWEPCVSPHKADFFAAVARNAPDVEILCVAHEGIPSERAAMGWSAPRPNDYTQHVAPSRQEISRLASADPTDTLHVFSGIRWVPTIVAALKMVKACHARFGMMVEPRVREGWRGELRVIQSWLTEGWFRRNTEFVLAIGRNGPPWFEQVGYSPNRLFPFAYFIDPQEVDDISTPCPSSTKLRIGYLGRLIGMKGVSDLLAATALLKDQPDLTIAGTGNQEVALKELAVQLGVQALFPGVIPISDVGKFMRSIDVLVLASNSKDDGWGVVVSEALMAGTAVIATDMVGASITLESPLAGAIVRPRSPQHIASAIECLGQQRAFELDARFRRTRWARDRLSATAGARYFISILEHRLEDASRPNPFYA